LRYYQIVDLIEPLDIFLCFRYRFFETVTGRKTMKAMVLRRAGERLHKEDVPKPSIEKNQVLVRVKACAVCRTDLHVVDGDLPRPKLPLIPGHEIVGIVEAVGEEVQNIIKGQKVGVPWLGYTCGRCTYCKKGMENLCENALFTGYTIDGGYAEYTAAYESYCFEIPELYPDVQAAPLLCAGLIGYRSLRMTGDTLRIGMYGFGAAAHILVQVARYQGREVYAFTRPGDRRSVDFARKHGAVWAGDSHTLPPYPLDAAIIFAPVGELVPNALRAVRPGGTVVCAGIHMSDIPCFPYNILWREKVLRSVANLTRKDGDEFFKVAPEVPVHTETTVFPLNDANEALDALRQGRIDGAAVLVV
jgi:propanol-preferring alcohol dehydrogenase